MDRKRRRKDTLYMSERHIRRLAAQEADIFYNSSHEIMSHDVNNKCTTLITNDYTMKPTTTDIKHKMEIEYNENNETFVQNDNDTFRLSDMADLQDYPVNISCNESNNLGSENESINDFDLQDDLAVWAVKHQITHTALTVLLYRLNAIFERAYYFRFFFLYFRSKQTHEKQPLSLVHWLPEIIRA